MLSSHPTLAGRQKKLNVMIGERVSLALNRYLGYGASIGAVNFPEVDLRAITAEQDDHVRLCYVHNNHPACSGESTRFWSPYKR
jgi:D-3-phosphoglycerate dehydrogenase